MKCLSVRAYLTIDAALFVLLMIVLLSTGLSMWLLALAFGFYVNGLLTGSRLLLWCLEAEFKEG